jgi:hypothetical protein
MDLENIPNNRHNLAKLPNNFGNSAILEVTTVIQRNPAYERRLKFCLGEE